MYVTSGFVLNQSNTTSLLPELEVDHGGVIVDRERLCDCVIVPGRDPVPDPVAIYASNVYRSVQVRGWNFNFLKGTCASDGRGKHRKGKKWKGTWQSLTGHTVCLDRLCHCLTVTCTNNSVTVWLELSGALQRKRATSTARLSITQS